MFFSPTDYTDEHGFFFEHEFHESHEYLLAHR